MRKSKTALARLLLLAPALFVTAGARADPVIDVITASLQIGEMDLATGTFTAAGSIPATIQYLVPSSNGLLTEDFGGNLESINPNTGATTVIGPTGFSDCSTPMSACGPHSQLSLGSANGVVYTTDFANNLYTINPSTGKATLIGPTGMPALPAVPLTTNPDGSYDFYCENLFEAGGKLYANFDFGTFNPATNTATPVISPVLYEINASTGEATPVGPTDFGLNTIANVNGTVYGFDSNTGAIVTLNVANGATTFVSNYDASAGLVEGAAATPEPSCLALACFGIAALIVFRAKQAVAAGKRSE